MKSLDSVLGEASALLFNSMSDVWSVGTAGKTFEDIQNYSFLPGRRRCHFLMHYGKRLLSQPPLPWRLVVFCTEPLREIELQKSYTTSLSLP